MSGLYMAGRWVSEEERDQIGALLAKADMVLKTMYLDSTLMIPEDFLPDFTQGTLFGYPVIRGPRFGVVIPVEVR